jgi:hypothetical protein
LLDKAERKTGSWCADNIVNLRQFQSGGGDTIMGLPDGITRNESSRFQLQAALPEE